jgi:hypothetical protein
MQIEAKSIRALIATLRNKGYVLYDKPYQLNIVGVRKDSTEPNKFDDLIYVFYKNDKGDWEGKYFTTTTDPGTYYLKNPLSNLGTAILKQGQYVDSYAIGKHKGQYDALVQRKPVTVIRDYDRNAILDFNNGREETGLFGINVHKAGKDSKDVDTWSAGCQVFQKSDDFNTFMNLARKHRELNGNKFTYTLIDERAYNRAMKRRLSYVVGIGLIIGAIYVGYKAYKGK